MKVFGSRRAVRIMLVLGFALVLVAGQRAWAWRHQVGEQQQRDAAAAAASAEVTRLISVGAKDSDAALKELVAGATAGFQKDLEAQATQLQKALVSNDVDATGAVVSTGVGRSSENQATVYVAATGTVSNKGTAAPQTRDYRIRVEMRRIEDRWLVSGLEFIG